MVVEVRGRQSGWIAVHAGIAGGADMILIPEQAYSITEIVESIQKRHERGKDFSIVVVAEGVKIEGTNGHVVSSRGKEESAT